MEMKGENEFAVVIDGLRNGRIKVDDALWYIASFKFFYNNNINP